MATAEIGALRVVLALNAGDYGRGLQKAARDTKDFGTTISRLSDQIEAASYEFNSGLMAAQRMISGIGAIVQVSRDFGSGMSAISTLVDTNTESMKEMQEAIFQIGRNAPVALTDLTTGLYDLRSAGMPAASAIDLLENSAKLAVSALGTTAEAVDIATSAINAFGLEGEQTIKFFDQMFKATAYGKMTISDFARGFGAVAGVVASAGVAVDEYLASVAALTTTGLPAAEAHTQIRAAIAGLTRESEMGKKVLDAMGVKTFAQLVEKSGGLVGAFNNIKMAMGGNAAQLIKLLGSVEAYNAVLGLTGKQAAVYTEALTAMRTGEESLGVAFGKRNEGMGAALDKMRNAFQELAVVLGEALTPAIQGLSSWVTSMTAAFKSLDPEVQTALATIGLIATVIGPAVVAIGFFINALSGIVGVIATVGAAIGALIAATGPVGAFVIVASAAVTAWNIFKDDIIAIWNAVANAISTKVQEIMAWMTRLGTYVSEVFGKIMEGDFTAAMDRMGQGMVDQFAKVEQHLEGVSVMMDVIKTKNEDAAKNAFVYAGPVIAANDAETESVSRRNSAHREGLALMKETLSPMEQIIFKQMEINALWTQGAIDATTYGRAMAQASVYSAKNMDALASSVSSNLNTIFGDTKAVAIASALINTYQGITKALATYPPPIAQAMAAIQAAAGFAQVANIKKQTSKGGGGGSAGASVSTAAAAPPPAQQSLMVQGIRPDQFLSGDVVKSLANRLLDFQRDGGRVVLQ